MYIYLLSSLALFASISIRKDIVKRERVSVIIHYKGQLS